MSLPPDQKNFDLILENLPERRKAVLRLFLGGANVPDIAKTLHIVEGTVRSQLSRLYGHFGLSTNKKHGIYDVRDELKNLFYEFKRDWLDPTFIRSSGYFDEFEYLDLKNISSGNYLAGIELLKQKEYQAAINFFQNAIDADDPLPQIFLNNAKACYQGKPMEIAVVVSYSRNDFHLDASKSVLRGVADAQTKFNEANGKEGRLLKIIIIDDHNQPEVASKVAKDLAANRNILAVIGHHSSEGTQAALPIYEQNSVAIVSPSSTSSNSKRKVFFRTVGSTKIVADQYADYIKKKLCLDNIAVFYHHGNEYSQALKDDFQKAFESRGGRISMSISNINDPHLDIVSLIKKIRSKNIKAVMVVSSIETNSVALAIARENSKLTSLQRLELFFSTSLPETSTLCKGGAAVEGITTINPCLAEESDYMKQAKSRWNQVMNWRSASSYDATQALIASIELSLMPTRSEILKNLENVHLSIDQTSGFGLHWSDSDYHSNDQRKYVISQIHHQRFNEIIAA
jgi:ABC-type branched-subunit amino acid transport system substrate-binding protein